MPTKFQISFEDSEHPPVMLSEGSNLSECLDVHNSPLLFGCRIGICGTCAIEVTEGIESLHPATEIEVEHLAVFAPKTQNCRLACQINLNSNIKVRKITL